ncbi:MAG: Zinc ribbon domain [Hyphomicrobiales bacterium]|nr:Zinc ribbon domain [Hyphomicrobiales bacterium]
MAEIVTCKSCGEPFEVVEVGGGMTSPEPEPMTCPHCGHRTMRLAQGRLRTRPVESPAKEDKN